MQTIDQAYDSSYVREDQANATKNICTSMMPKICVAETRIRNASGMHESARDHLKERYMVTRFPDSKVELMVLFSFDSGHRTFLRCSR